MPLTVEVGYGEDQERVLGTIREILMQNGRILKTPEPEVGIVSLADAGVPERAAAMVFGGRLLAGAVRSVSGALGAFSHSGISRSRTRYGRSGCGRKRRERGQKPRLAVLSERTRLSGFAVVDGVFHFPSATYLPIVTRAFCGFH